MMRARPRPPLLPWLAAFSGALALLATGCAQNAILELQVDLPPAPLPSDGGSWFAQVQVRRASDHPFDIPWMGGEDQVFELGDTRQWGCISVVSGSQELDLHLRVRFCRAEDCLDLLDGTPRERLYTLEHPLYIGRHTYYRITDIGEVPDCATDGDCGGIGACISGVCGCGSAADCGGGGLTCEGGTCLRTVGRCAIEGCIEGVSTTFCSVEDSTHFCESNPDILRQESFECAVR
jgi:hypothetical protein